MTRTQTANPTHPLTVFLADKLRSAENLTRFAREHGIAPSVVINLSNGCLDPAPGLVMCLRLALAFNVAPADILIRAGRQDELDLWEKAKALESELAKQGSEK